MTGYRAYIMGIDGHRFVKAAGFLSDYPDDTAALKAAERLVDGHDVELWDCSRLVARMGHASRANTASGEMAKAHGSGAVSVNFGDGPGLVDERPGLTFSTEGARAADPAPQTPDPYDQKASPTSGRDGGWRSGRRTVSTIARLFRRGVG